MLWCAALRSLLWERREEFPTPDLTPPPYLAAAAAPCIFLPPTLAALLTKPTTKEYTTEPVFVNLLRSSEIDSQPGLSG
jgi:hypothetical protein